MKTALFLFLLLIALPGFSQSKKTINKQLKQELVAAGLGYDSLYAEHTAQVAAFGNVVEDFNKKLKSVKNQRRETRNLSEEIRVKCRNLTELGVDPAGITDVSNIQKGNFPEYVVTSQDEAVLTDTFSFGKPFTDLNLKDVKIDVQNDYMRARLSAYRYVSVRMKNDMALMDHLKTSVLKLDSLDKWYQTMITDYSERNSLLELKLNELKEDFRLKGPKGFPSVYNHIFRIFPVIDTSSYELKAPTGKQNKESHSNTLKSSKP